MSPEHRPLGRGPEAGTAFRTRSVAIVIIAAFAGWMTLSWIGGAIGLPLALALAIDVVCLAALGWALVTLIAMRRSRRDGGT